MNIIVIDNFLDQEDFADIKDSIVKSNDFPWFYTPVLYEDLNCTDNDNYQLSHMLYNNNILNSDNYSIVYPFLVSLEINSLVRVKLNFNPRTEKVIEHGLHTDVSFKCLTAVYYLNTNDGYTKFESGEKIDSVENRIVIFDSTKKHTGTTCTNEVGRYVINFNFFSEKKFEEEFEK